VELEYARGENARVSERSPDPELFASGSVFEGKSWMVGAADFGLESPAACRSVGVDIEWGCDASDVGDRWLVGCRRAGSGVVSVGRVVETLGSTALPAGATTTLFTQYSFYVQSVVDLNSSYSYIVPPPLIVRGD
jgi:hypothetical protein